MTDPSHQSRQLSEGEFMRLFVKHEPALKAFARSLLPDWTAVDDALQEASVTMWEKLGQLRDADGFLPWAGIDLQPVTSARLRLNLVPSTRGLASRLPKINRFGIYGVTNDAKVNWPNETLWDDSPSPEDGVLLGTFEIPRSQQRGSFGIQNVDLLDFLKSSRDGSATLVLIRETTQIEGEGPGLTHLFASDSHPESVGPMLEFSISE